MKIDETQAIVLERLIEAMETDIALPIRIGPKAFGSAMPETVQTYAEWFANKREDIAETGGKRTRAQEAYERRKTERRAKCSKERVTRMEEAFGWVLAHVQKPEHRKVLLAYAEVKARGWQWERYIQNRNRRNPPENAWVKRTVQRWIVLSLQDIAENIPKDDILLAAEADLLLAQIEGESTGKSIRSDLRSWMSPDGKPSYRRTM
jgi:hypothetical protein